MAKQARRNRNTDRRSGYVYGSEAPKLDIRRQIEVEEPVRRVSRETKKNREKMHGMSPAYVLLLMVSLCAACVVLIWYVNLQSRVTSQVATINKLEKQLNLLKQDNDEEWSRINNNIDLEEIKRIAICELGMTYAQEGQIVTYTGEGTDYMRKVVED